MISGTSVPDNAHGVSCPESCLRTAHDQRSDTEYNTARLTTLGSKIVAPIGKTATDISMGK